MRKCEISSRHLFIDLLGLLQRNFDIGRASALGSLETHLRVLKDDAFIGANTLALHSHEEAVGVWLGARYIVARDYMVDALLQTEVVHDITDVLDVTC